MFNDLCFNRSPGVYTCLLEDSVFSLENVIMNIYTIIRTCFQIDIVKKPSYIIKSSCLLI